MILNQVMMEYTFNRVNHDGIYDVLSYATGVTR